MIRKIFLFCLNFILVIIFFLMSPFYQGEMSRSDRDRGVLKKITTFSPANITPTPSEISITPTEIRNLKSEISITPTSVGDTAPWGVAVQIGEHTWTMKVGEDSTMATANEILKAVNDYRQKFGSQILTLDNKLTSYAQSRADFFYSIDKLDSHAGFINFLDNEDGFNKLGFSQLGENSSIGYQLNGVHLIEWVYAGDEAHNKNQLNTSWDHVGIGVKGTATCLIFGTGRF